MGLFSNPRKELDETLEGLYLNFGANNGNRKSSPVAERLGKAEILIDRLVAHSNAAEARSAVDRIAAKEPQCYASMRGLTEQQVAAAAAELAAHPQGDEVLTGWAELCSALRSRAGR